LLTIAAPIALVGVLAFNDGGFDLALRQQVWLVVCWTLALGLAFSVFPRAVPPRGWALAAGALAAIAAMQAVAVIWAPSTESALADAARSGGYLGILVLAWAALGPRSWRHAAAGLAIVAAGVTVFSLLGRLAPSIAGLNDLERAIGTERLYAPLDYWNAMGAWAAATLATALAWSADARRAHVRACAAALIPVAGTVIYLTYSRGAVLAVVVGIAIVLGLTRNRGRAVLHVVAGVVATALCVAAVRSQPAIANGESGEGGLLVGVSLVLAAGALWLFVARSTTTIRRSPVVGPARPIASVRIGVTVVGITLGLVAVALIGGRDGIGGQEEVVSAYTTDPSSRLATADGARTAYWLEALDGLGAQPLRGEGPGSFANRWAQRATDPALVNDAHSLLFETGSELGMLGLVALAVLVAGLIRVVLTGLLGARRSAPAIGLLATVAVFGLSVAIDWTWESTALATLALGSAGVLSMAASTSIRTGRSARADGGGRLSPRSRWAAVVIAILIGAAQIPAVVAQVFLDEADDQRQIGNTDGSIANAEEALTAAPWSASAYVALAEARLASGDLEQARADALEAIEREPRDAEHRVLLARIEASSDDLGAAAEALREAVRISPFDRSYGSDEVESIGRRLEDIGLDSGDIDPGT